MSRRRKLAIGAICGALVATLPASAGAVFPGTNGEIAFVSGRNGGDSEADVYIIDGPSDTTPSGPLAPAVAGQHRHPSWSPDTKRIVVAVRQGANNDLWMRDVEQGSGSNITLSPTVLEDHPTFSPDGELIAYESEVGDGAGVTDILIANADGSGTPTPLTDTNTLIESTPVWAPNGNRIYYAVKSVGFDYDVAYRPAGGGAQTLVLDAAVAGDQWQPEISPDGDRLCYTDGALFSPNADVMVANINGEGDPAEVSTPDAPMMPIADYNCGWSPDGTTIAYTHGLTTAGNLHFVPSGGGTSIPYGGNSTFFDGNVDWAPVPGTCNGKPATIAGTDGDDQIAGTSGKDVIVAFKGNDRVNGRGGNDQICGGKGGDTLSGAKGKDKLFGQKGRDKLNGGPDRDRCDGGPGKDSASRCERKDKI